MSHPMLRTAGRKVLQNIECIDGMTCGLQCLLQTDTCIGPAMTTADPLFG